MNAQRLAERDGQRTGAHFPVRGDDVRPADRPKPPVEDLDRFVVEAVVVGQKDEGTPNDGSGFRGFLHAGFLIMIAIGPLLVVSLGNSGHSKQRDASFSNAQAAIPQTPIFI
jgi:hypothetical protein